jgi:selenide,water dikinase
VYKLTPECALIQTVDFFTPIVDDPFTFGAIAAANSLSDVYAMGGVPLTSLSIVAYPAKGDLDDLQQILKGGASKMNEAGCVILGGHSINDDEIKFGYAVTGTVHPDRVWANNKAHEGDTLVFTKAIGTGVIATALKRDIASEDHVRQAVDSMLRLNRDARDAVAHLEVHACTDVTGFGLLGHAREMVTGTSVTFEIDASQVPFLPGAVEYSRQGAIPGGLNNNREFVAPCVEVSRPLDPAVENLLYDPQTSGGLLLTLPRQDAEKLAAAFPSAQIIGKVVPRGEKPIRIV